MSRIGGGNPGKADLPIPGDEAALAQLRHMLRTPGELATVNDLPAHNEVPQYPGLFSGALYADVSGPESGDSLFDSAVKQPTQAASAPLPIVHYLEVPRKRETPPAPSNSLEGRPSHGAQTSSWALVTGQEAEKRIRERLLQDGSGGAPQTSQKLLPPPSPDKPVNKFAVNWVRELLNGKGMPKIDGRDLDRVSADLKKIGLNPAEVHLDKGGKPYFFVPAVYPKMVCEAAIDRVEEYAFYAESLNDKDASARAQGLLHFLRQRIEDLSQPDRVPRYCTLNDSDPAEVEARKEVVRKHLCLEHEITVKDLARAGTELKNRGLIMCGCDEGIFYKLPPDFIIDQGMKVAIERYTMFAWALMREVNVRNGLDLLETVQKLEKF